MEKLFVVEARVFRMPGEQCDNMPGSYKKWVSMLMSRKYVYRQ
jgi:hypothetical protein